MLVRDRISAERRKQGISVAGLALAVGVNKGSISRYESGYVKEIPTEVLHRLAVALNIDFDELVAEDPKYCMLSEKYIQRTKAEIGEGLNSEEEQLVLWYRGLPDTLKRLVNQIRAVDLSQLSGPQ